MVAEASLALSTRDGISVIEAGRNSAEHAPSSAATGASAASDDTCAVASTANIAVSVHRAASDASITSRGPNRSASDPPGTVSNARGTP